MDIGSWRVSTCSIQTSASLRDPVSLTMTNTAGLMPPAISTTTNNPQQAAGFFPPVFFNLLQMTSFSTPEPCRGIHVLAATQQWAGPCRTGHPLPRGLGDGGASGLPQPAGSPSGGGEKPGEGREAAALRAGAAPANMSACTDMAPLVGLAAPSRGTGPGRRSPAERTLCFPRLSPCCHSPPPASPARAARSRRSPPPLVQPLRAAPSSLRTAHARNALWRGQRPGGLEGVAGAAGAHARMGGRRAVRAEVGSTAAGAGALRPVLGDR